jgi:glycogen operon protein
VTAPASPEYRTAASLPIRLGARTTPDGVSFGLYAKRATGVDLLLFDAVDDRTPATVISLDRTTHETGGYWHVDVEPMHSGQLYGYRVHGPWAPAQGLRFDPSQSLLDPYARGVAVPDAYRPVGAGQADPGSIPMKSVVIDVARYDWEGDQPLNRSFRDTIVYEAHVGGFTKDPASGVGADRRGTYLGFIEKIPYLVSLGITAVELLPVFEFDRFAAPAGLINYWGYQPVSFFAPHHGYAIRRDGDGPSDEFRDLVKALHRVGIEVILDVVFNHTAEGGADGPTFSFKGFANDDYYLLDAAGNYVNDSGTGNTLNANNTIVRRLILDSLRYWVEEMHVDGFRFDLAAVLSRGQDGARLADPPTLWDIETDPVLAGTKLIAEAWDAGGLYEVGSFVGDRWVEWNGRFRDDARAFVKGDPGQARNVALRFLGSPDIYGPRDREPQVSLNFVTCHDGFTLNDLVSYNTKHNEANGEDNRDGSDQNESWNCGVEGPTGDPAIDGLRERQIKNFLVLNLFALGVPMLLMGDEVRRTQNGNNNDYCHDDPTAWFDWGAPDRNRDLLRFTRALVGLRRRFVANFDPTSETGLEDVLRNASIEWSGVTVGQPDLSADSHSIALTARVLGGALQLIFNAYWEPLDFELPDPGAETDGWQRVLDTSEPSPNDVVTDIAAAVTVADSYHVGPRSIVVLAARRAIGAPPVA